MQTDCSNVFHNLSQASYLANYSSSGFIMNCILQLLTKMKGGVRNLENKECGKRDRKCGVYVENTEPIENAECRICSRCGKFILKIISNSSRENKENHYCDRGLALNSPRIINHLRSHSNTRKCVSSDI